MAKAWTDQAEAVEVLSKRGVKFVARENTMRRKSIFKQDLLPGVGAAPSGAVEVVRKQQSRREEEISVQTITQGKLEDQRRRGLSVDPIDARTAVQHPGVHAEAAGLVPKGRLDPWAVMESRDGARDDPLYAIRPSASRGRQACEAFHPAGLIDAVNVEGGALACEKAGPPVVQGMQMDTCGMGMMAGRMPRNRVETEAPTCMR